MNNFRSLLIIILCFITMPAIAAEKLYVAVEGEGTLAVIDTHTNKVINRIALAEHSASGHTPLAPHNVQVAPDGRSVWVTAIAGGHGNAHAEHDAAAPADQVIIINPTNDAIVRRISIAAGIHLAHVVLTPDSRYAYATAQDGNSVYKINARDYRVEKRIALPAKSQPHGLRISSKDNHAYIALLGGNGLAVLDLATDQVVVHNLPGAAVQTAVTNTLVFISLYDTKQIAIFNPGSHSIGYMKLPHNSKGPVQLYPTPDGRYLLVADQGYYFEQPANREVYKLDTNSGAVVARITAGEAPHGVVVAPHGNLAYITNLLSGDVSVIDTLRNSEVAKISVGNKPNGVSLWSSEFGGTP